MRTLAAALSLAMLACATTTRQPDTFSAQVDTDLTVEEAVPHVVEILESLDYSIESAQRSQGVVIGERSALQGERVTVTLQDEDGQLSLQVVGEADAGPSDAENAAHEVRDRIERELRRH